jgi:hypothetical protein
MFFYIEKKKNKILHHLKNNKLLRVIIAKLRASAELKVN